MAYNPYIPQFYPPVQAGLPTYNTNSQQNSITWVQGENAAKSYPIGAGQSILLMDSENPVLYIKSTDQSGMPSLRIFDYKERIQNGKEEKKVETDNKDYISREEFDKFKEDVKEMIKFRPNNYKKPNKED